MEDTLLAIADEVAGCTACPLYERPDDTPPGKAHVAVAGVGPTPAEIMVVGEAPGITEGDAGGPFLGRSGAFLDKLMEFTSLARADVFVTNVVKHRPPKNRNPKVKEMKACGVWLDRQLALVRPSIIIAMGAVAAKFFDKGSKLGSDHGRARRVERNGVEYYLIPMYHPAVGLRDAEKYSILVEDFSRLDAELDICRAAVALPPTNYTLLTDYQATATVLSAQTLGFDLETTSPKKGKYADLQEFEITGWSVGWAPSEAAFVEGKPKWAGAFLSNPAYTKVAHNTKFEYARLDAIDIPLVNWEDTKLAAWLLQYHDTGLKALARQMLGRDPITYEQVTQGRDMIEIDPREEQMLVDYGAADSDNALLIWPRLRKELAEADLLNLYEDVEKPIVPILVAMEKVGIGIDEVEARKVFGELDEATIEARADVYAAGVPEGYDVGSTDDLAAYLEEVGAPIAERTEVKGQLKTDEDTLLKLEESGWAPELMRAILHYRSMRKTRSYAEQYLELRGRDGRLHPDFIQVGSGLETGADGPVTGRFACRAPNFQNQPKRKGGEWVKRLRRCVIAHPGWKLIAGDISQEEIRIATIVTGDRVMTADIAAGRLLYKGFAEGIYNRDIDKHRDPMEWNIGKQCVLSFIWGTGGKHSWAPRLLELDQEQGAGTLTLRDAQQAYDRLAKKYSDIVIWRKRIWKGLYEKGYVRDMFGRRRLSPKVYHPDRKVKMEGHREAMNFLIQAPAATVLKLAMIRVEAALRTAGLRAYILLTIHDELVLEAPDDEVDRVVEILYSMTKGLAPVELPVEVAVGINWGEMEERE